MTVPGKTANLLRKRVERVKGIEPSSKFRMSTDVFLLSFFIIKPRWTRPDVSTSVSTEMASIHRRPRSPYWHGAFRQGAKLVLRSTGSTDKAVARRIADEWEQIARQAEGGTHIEQQTREVIVGILKRANVESHSIKTPSLKAFLDGWLASKLSALAKGSAWSYQKAVDGFLTWAGKKAGMPIAAIQPQDARAYIASLQSANYASKTVSVYGKVLRSAFKQAITDGLIPNNPFAAAIPKVAKGAVKAHRRGVFTPTELRMLLEAAKGHSEDWHTAVLVGICTGARLRDCCRLQWDDIDLAEATLNLHQLKTGSRIQIPIHPALLEHLEALASQAGDQAAAFLTPALAEAETGGAHGLSRQFAAIMREAGVSAGKTSSGTRRQQSERGFHSLRHTFISALAAADIPAELRMKLSGHADLKSHSGYTHTETSQLAEALRRMKV
jgi:integrase